MSLLIFLTLLQSLTISGAAATSSNLVSNCVDNYQSGVYNGHVAANGCDQLLIHTTSNSLYSETLYSSSDPYWCVSLDAPTIVSSVAIISRVSYWYPYD